MSREFRNASCSSARGEENGRHVIQQSSYHRRRHRSCSGCIRHQEGLRCRRPRGQDRQHRRQALEGPGRVEDGSQEGTRLGGRRTGQEGHRDGRRSGNCQARGRQGQRVGRRQVGRRAQEQGEQPVRPRHCGRPARQGGHQDGAPARAPGQQDERSPRGGRRHRVAQARPGRPDPAAGSEARAGRLDPAAGCQARSGRRDPAYQVSSPVPTQRWAS